MTKFYLFAPTAMGINISVPKQEKELKPKIIIFGVGGAGGNAVNNMVAANLEGVDFWIANTDAQALANSPIPAGNKIQLGIGSTKGLGAGSNPEVGCAAAEESIDDIKAAISGCHMLFITAGMGGGTGTGAAPVIARIAKEEGILVVGVVTKPFHFEGARRMKIAELGIEGIARYIDTLIIIPNQNLFRVVNEKTTLIEAFKIADDVLHSGVRSVTDLITMPGLINLDFADIRAVMHEMGRAMMGTGEAEGEGRAIRAAEFAIANPLLDQSSMKGAKGVLINITGGMDMTLFEVDEAANRIKEEVLDQPNANIIFGSAFNTDLHGVLRVSVVATGIELKSNGESETSKLLNTRHVTVEAPLQPVAVTPNVMTTGAKDAESVVASVEYSGDFFIPPKAAHPSEVDVVENAEGPRPLHFKQNSSGIDGTVGLFGTVVSDLQHKQYIEQNHDEKKQSNLFEIPAFLRKKSKVQE